MINCGMGCEAVALPINCALAVPAPTVHLGVSVPRPREVVSCTAHSALEIVHVMQGTFSLWALINSSTTRIPRSKDEAHFVTSGLCDSALRVP